MTEFAPLNLSSIATPATQEEVAAQVRDSFAENSPLYLIGGGTSLDYGLPPKQAGIGMVLTGLNRVIDFPARDLTVTVEAGITMQALSELLATEGLRLPIDVPHPERATLGGVIATAWCGPRRYGHGLVRDSVIGIRAVDGRGEVFNGGGRVVKNVAGYDFCKLLTGSLGTLGVITQVTLKLRPVSPHLTVALLSLPALVGVEHVLSDLTQSDIAAVAIELLQNPSLRQLAIALEGTSPEVDWLVAQTRLLAERHQLSIVLLEGDMAEAKLREFTDFSATPAPLVLKASVKPSAIEAFMHGVLAVEPKVQLQASAGSGIVYIRFAEFPTTGLSRTLVGKLQPLAAQYGGHVVVLSNPSGQEMTPQSVWGSIGPQLELMQSVKREFDPKNILNPGRFVFA